MFETSYEEQGNLLPEGDYECIIKSAFLSATRSNTPREYFSVRFVVRNDVPQKYQNKNIFHAIWWRNYDKQTDDDKKVGGFSYKQIMNLCRAVGVPAGMKFKDLDELGEYLKGKCCLVTVGHDEWNGKKQERVKWANQTKYPNCTHQFPPTVNADSTVNYNSATTNANPTSGIDEVLDEDLPF